MHRRAFLRTTIAGGVGAAAFGADFWRAAYSQQAAPGAGPYGSLEGRSPDDNDLVLPEGFTSRVIGVNGETVPGTSLEWHTYPDGGATFETDDGGWVYVSNAEVEDEGGGVSAVRFAADGSITDAYRLLEGTTRNCSGGPTPWGTWLSCEEYDSLDAGGSSAGLVWECDPLGAADAVRRPALGAFSHEAVAVDPDRQVLYLTEDQPDGRLYRFTPASWPSLESGLLEVAFASASGRVTWFEVPDPSGASGGPLRRQVPASTAFDGGEGIWFDEGSVYFTTKGDNRVWRLDCERQRLEVVYDITKHEESPLSGVDNITVSDSGDIFVAEDGGDMQLVCISREREIAPFLQVVGHEKSELCGPAFSPDGSRLYVSSMRGGPRSRGVTYEVTGPFRGASGAGGAGGAGGSTDGRLGTTDALAIAQGDEGGLGGGELAALGGTALLAAGLSALVLKARRGPTPPDPDPS